MKRNLFPFLGIAFVVAIAATGIFYGLFVGKISGAAPPAAAPARVVVAARALNRGMVVTAGDVRLQPAGAAERPEGAFGVVDDVVGRTMLKAVAANEPVTAGVLAGVKGASGLTIPKGMRAMSIHVADSTGLIPYLRPGNRIDVQVIQTHGGELQARTLLSNVEILNVHADTNPQPAPATIVNLLVPAKDVERVALADSASKVRIVLRNGEDRDEIPVAPAAANAGTQAQARAAAGPRVSFQVRIASAAADAVREIASRAGMTPDGDGAVRIGLMPADWNAEAALPQMEKARSLRMLSSESVDSSNWHEVSLQAGGAPHSEYDLRLRLKPLGAGNGTVRLRVRPELTLPQRGGVSSRKFSADLNVAEGQSVLVAGFERDAPAPALVEKLFHSQAPQPAGAELLMVVTPRLVAAR
jgi:Flp pilus assembly protein CpaB